VSSLDWSTLKPGTRLAAAWLGHSTLVAHKHYWQITDADFERALIASETTSEKAAQKAAQSTAETLGNARNQKDDNTRTPREFPGLPRRAEQCTSV
jgi:hypothetical protein